MRGALAWRPDRRSGGAPMDRSARSAGLRGRTTPPARSAASSAVLTAAPFTRAVLYRLRLSCASAATFAVGRAARTTAASAPSRTIGASCDTRCEPSVADDRFGEVRLALAVSPDERSRPRRAPHRPPHSSRKSTKAQLLDDHRFSLRGAADVGGVAGALARDEVRGKISAATGSSAAGT